MTEPLLTAEDVAAMLGVTVGWIYTETRAGRIPHVKLGRYRRYRRQTIDRWLEDLEASSVVASNKSGRAALERPRPGNTNGGS